MLTGCQAPGKTFGAGRKSEGFTLIELMVAVALVGILAALAIGTMQAGNFRVKNAAENLVSDLNRVRAEAIRANQNIGVVFGAGDYNATGAGLRVVVTDSITIDSHFGGTLTFNSLGAAPNALNGWVDMELAKDNATHCRVKVNNAGRIWIQSCQL